jgi:mono/diheme cytochrome c family protein
MRKQYRTKFLESLSLAVLLWLAATGVARGQFTQNRDKIKIDPAGFPADIHKGYQVFREKCNECHGLDTSLKPSMSPAQWAFEVKRMQAMASSQFNDKEAKVILDFLNYDEAHRKSQNKPATQAAPSGTAAAGRQFYETQGCDTCHAIGGKGGNAGPSLSDVGKRLNRNQISEVIQAVRMGKSSSMPPLPPESTDQQVKDLIDFLTTLTGN